MNPSHLKKLALASCCFISSVFTHTTAAAATPSLSPLPPLPSSVEQCLQKYGLLKDGQTMSEADRSRVETYCLANYAQDLPAGLTRETWQHACDVGSVDSTAGCFASNKLAAQKILLTTGAPWLLDVGTNKIDGSGTGLTSNGMFIKRFLFTGNGTDGIQVTIPSDAPSTTTQFVRCTIFTQSGQTSIASNFIVSPFGTGESYALGLTPVPNQNTYCLPTLLAPLASPLGLPSTTGLVAYPQNVPIYLVCLGAQYDPTTLATITAPVVAPPHTLYDITATAVQINATPTCPPVPTSARTSLKPLATL